LWIPTQSIYRHKSCVLMKLATSADFTNMFTQSFYECRSQKCKKTVKSAMFVYTLGICICKSCSSKTLLILTSGVNFTNMLTRSVYEWISLKHKKTVKSSTSFCAFRICMHKSSMYLKCWLNWLQISGATRRCQRWGETI